MGLYELMWKFSFMITLIGFVPIFIVISDYYSNSLVKKEDFCRIIYVIFDVV